MTDVADTQFLQQAVDLAVQNVAEGGGPFGALIVSDSSVLAAGENRVTRDIDPTAHAEVTAIRRACHRLGTFSLEGCVLYASCEPCPMCASAALWSRLDRIVFAADRADAARGGFDDSRFWELVRLDYPDWDIPVDADRVAGSFAPFAAWQRSPARVDY